MVQLGKIEMLTAILLRLKLSDSEIRMCTNTSASAYTNRKNRINRKLFPESNMKLLNENICTLNRQPHDTQCVSYPLCRNSGDTETHLLFHTLLQLRLSQRPTIELRVESLCLMCMLLSAFRGGYAVHIHRPTQGWTVKEDILLCKVSLLHPPSSLGLDGDGTFLPRHNDLPEVQKEPSSPYLTIVKVCEGTTLSHCGLRPRLLRLSGKRQPEGGLKSSWEFT